MSTDSILLLCDKVFGFADRQLQALINSYPDQFPMYTDQGHWTFGGESWTNWCEGFLGGQLWLLYQHTRQAWWQEQAVHYTRLIEPRKTDRDVHDLGFVFWPTWKRWFDLTQDSHVNQVVIEAGRTLALRYQPHGGYLCSFLAPNSLFIDIMMNVGIVFYAAQQTGDEKLYQIALDHCLTTRKYLVRGDGSTAHEGIFDLESGQFIHQSTQQGWRGDSSWARGLAWAIYGFGTAYDFTLDERFLATAQACADFYIQRTPPNGIPPNDWDEPVPQYPYESSAGAIACCGILRLAKKCHDLQKREAYHQYAGLIFETLCTPEFLADQTPGWEGLLKHGIYHQGKGLGVDESVLWGDYFFLESAMEIYHDCQ